MAAFFLESVMSMTARRDEHVRAGIEIVPRSRPRSPNAAREASRSRRRARSRRSGWRTRPRPCGRTAYSKGCCVMTIRVGMTASTRSPSCIRRRSSRGSRGSASAAPRMSAALASSCRFISLILSKSLSLSSPSAGDIERVRHDAGGQADPHHLVAPLDMLGHRACAPPGPADAP